nr:hypothetical protein [Methanococcoides methylutens]
MNNEMGILNSSLPFLIKYMWAVKAKMPAKLKTSENTNPVKDC